MFDTIAGKLAEGPYRPRNLSRDPWEVYTKSSLSPKYHERQERHFETLSADGARIAILHSPTEGDFLRVESSLPKLLHGNNLDAVVQPEQALKLLRELLCDFVDGQIPSLLQMESLRVDFCHNFNVGSALPDYVRTLSQIAFLKHRRLTDGYDGVEWLGAKNSGLMIRAYDKFHEILEKDKVSMPEARGHLRFEVEVRKKGRYLQRRLKKAKLTFQDVLQPRVGYCILTEVLNRMCADFRFLPFDSAMSILDNNFSIAKANRLRGVLERLKARGMEAVKRETPRGTFYGDKANLRRLGLFPPADGVKELPGLALPSLDDLIQNAGSLA